MSDPIIEAGQEPDGPEHIWLQPDCCADPGTGRLWCQDNVFDDCDEGMPATEYIRVDIAARKVAEERERCAAIASHAGLPEIAIAIRKAPGK